jgi:hypothetical protein
MEEENKEDNAANLLNLAELWTQVGDPEEGQKLEVLRDQRISFFPSIWTGS